MAARRTTRAADRVQTPAREKRTQVPQPLRRDQELTKPAVHPRNTLNDLDSREWVRHTKSWFVADGKRGEITRDIEKHPASYPPEAAARFIKLFTKKGANVLDPFAGCGSTLQAAMELDRKGYGVELSGDFCELMNRRFSQIPQGLAEPVIINGDSRQIADCQLPLIDLVVTSPPYWNMLKNSRGNVRSAHAIRREKGLMEDYGDDTRDLGNIEEYRDYIHQISELLLGVKAVMRPGAHMVVIVQNVREKSGVMRPVAWDIASELSRELILRQEFIWCQDQKRLGCWGYPTTYVSNLHHHYCLIFQKEKE